MTRKLPVLTNDGRSVLGYAKTVEGAKRVLRKTIDIHPSMTLDVWRRDPLMVEINGGLDGWMFSISYYWGGTK